MKSFCVAIIALLLPCWTYAQSVTTLGGSGATRSGNVIIVNGKKFFLLSNARHFVAGPNSPSALNVMHHPRPIVRARPGTTHAAAGSHTAAVPGDALTPTPGGAASGTPTGSASDVLSIFSPDEKAPSATPPR